VFLVAGTNGSAGEDGRGLSKGKVALEVSRGQGGGILGVGTRVGKQVVGCGLEHTR